MTDTFGKMEAARGERCGNNGFETRFTCPGCYTDFERTLKPDSAEFIRCECGAPLRLTVEMVPEATATIADADEEEENLEPFDIHKVVADAIFGKETMQ